MISRRGLITGLIALVAAPAIIRTPGLLMPIKGIQIIIPDDWEHYTSQFKWNRGLIAEDWKYAIRISLPQQAWRQLNAHDEQPDLV